MPWGKKMSQPFPSNGLTEVGQTEGSCLPLTGFVMKNRGGQQGTRVTRQGPLSVPPPPQEALGEDQLFKRDLWGTRGLYQREGHAAGEGQSVTPW